MFKIRIFLLINIWLFGFSGVSFHSTELALNSSENVRGNYLSNDDIYDHMNLQLTFGGQGVWAWKLWKGKQRINCKWRIGLQGINEAFDWTILYCLHTCLDHRLIDCYWLLYLIRSLIDRLLLITIWSDRWSIDNPSAAIFKWD